jgi:hypothetical protein
MNIPNYQAGQKLNVFMGGKIVEGEFLQDYRGVALMLVSGKKITRNYGHVLKYNPAAPAAGSPASVVSMAVEASAPAAPAPQTHYIDVNTRFQYIEAMTDMIVRGQQKAFVVTGSGGIGKSHTIFGRLKSHDLGEGHDYSKISGHMTPMALYRALHDHQDDMLVFDDCDSVLNGDTCQNMLKAALDSFGDRTVTWATERGSSGDLPSHFQFNGRVIFISNYSLDQIPQPLVSRALYVDVTMTPEEKMTRIRAIAPQLCPDIDDIGRAECIELIDSVRDQIFDLNLRTLLKVVSLRKANPAQWYNIARYMITAKLSNKR